MNIKEFFTNISMNIRLGFTQYLLVMKYYRIWVSRGFKIGLFFSTSSSGGSYE